MNRFVRRAPFASALGIFILMLLGAGVLPAMAAPEKPPESAATPPSDEVVQALVVGSTAFALMIGAAGAVLYYTARQRRQGREW